MRQRVNGNDEASRFLKGDMYLNSGAITGGAPGKQAWQGLDANRSAFILG